MTDKDLLVANRICQYTKAVMPPVKWSDDYTTNPKLNNVSSYVKSVIHLRLGVYGKKEARKVPIEDFKRELDIILPEVK